MNKLLALVLVISALLCSIPTRSQSKLLQPSQRERSVSIGVNGVFHLSTFLESAGGGIPYLPGTGWGAGGSVNVPFAERFSFQGELQYDRFRSLETGALSNVPSTDYTVSEAVSVPLLIQYEFGKRRNIFLNFGPELRFNTRAFDKTYYSGGSRTTTNLYDCQAIAPVSLAFAVGIGMRLPIAKKFDFLWEIRLSSDLTSLSRELDYRWEFGQEHRYDFNDDENFRRLNLAIKAGFAYRF